MGLAVVDESESKREFWQDPDSLYIVQIEVHVVKVVWIINGVVSCVSRD
jgi:hypothetical protein